MKPSARRVAIRYPEPLRSRYDYGEEGSVYKHRSKLPGDEPEENEQDEWVRAEMKEVEARVAHRWFQRRI
jgi:hypothetical protein